jgi:hypothetical protein
LRIREFEDARCFFDRISGFSGLTGFGSMRIWEYGYVREIYPVE